MNATLPAIAALVRAGAIARAREHFEAGGHALRTGDPAALALKGRLLKAQARLAPAEERTDLFAAAARAYAAAHALAPAPYLAINAASLDALAGDDAAARRQAQQVIALLASDPPPADTPYFLAATLAEAHLLLDRQDEAARALEQAVAHDPDGWDDRAATLGQLREILTARGQSADWLERFAPPQSLHFAGHMGMAPNGESEAALQSALDAFFATHPIGFAWGALAAGADIVIAERLLENGAQLHVVLPCPPVKFASQSVAPAGAQWLTRFDRLLKAAASIRVAGEDGASVHDPLATAHAGRLAIGGALLNARRLGARSCQLIVTDQDDGGTNTRTQAEMWPLGAGEQIRLTVPRDAAVENLFPPEDFDPARQLAIHVAAGFAQPASDASPAQIAAAGAAMAEALSGIPQEAIRAAPLLWEFSTPDLAAALQALARIQVNARQAGFEPIIGAELAIARVVRDSASGTEIAYGPAPALARRLMNHAPAGLAFAGDALAVTMALSADWPLRSELYLPDEEDLGGAVHLLLPRHQ